MIKEIIRVIKRNTIDKILFWNKSRKCFTYDFKTIYGNSLEGKESVRKIETRIMLGLHQLEKGMTYKDSARIFGESKALSVVNEVKKLQKIGHQSEIVNLAINVLNEYLKNQNSTKDEKIRKSISQLINENGAAVGKYHAGIKVVSEPPTFDVEKVKEFFFSRHSVREFSKEAITDEEIIRVVDFANCTPTACNRQTSRVHVYRDPNVMKALIDNQLGDQNWCHNAIAIFVITSDLNCFNSNYEHLQAFVDGGLYAMNFDWGLHLFHIASCYKMYVRLPKIDQEFHKLSGIPDNEVPIVLILAGHYKDTPIISPKSVRFPAFANNNLCLHS
ncbi:MAG: nitroreductase family protein [Bacteroidaceae bacterium]|nr:nitroreductase family protein [Bacteroidaceae bacterium]